VGGWDDYSHHPNRQIFLRLALSVWYASSVYLVSFTSQKNAELIAVHKYHKTQNIKYYVLVVFLLMAAIPGCRICKADCSTRYRCSRGTVNLLLLPIARLPLNVIIAPQSPF
jgi:hypothetical protein